MMSVDADAVAVRGIFKTAKYLLLLLLLLLQDLSSSLASAG